MLSPAGTGSGAPRGGEGALLWTGSQEPGLQFGPVFISPGMLGVSWSVGLELLPFKD